MASETSARGAVLLPLAAVVGSISALCIGAAFAKRLFPLVGATGVTGLRIGFAAFILLVIWRPWRLALDAAQARRIAIYGVVLGTMNLLFYLSLRTIPLGLAIAIEFTGPLCVAVFASRRRSDLVWVGLAAAGLLLLLPIAPGPALDAVGVAYAFGAAVCWGLYILIGRKVGEGHPGQAIALGMTVAALVALPVGLASAGAALLAPAVLVGGLLVAVMSSAIPYSLELYALPRLPRHTFGVMMSLEPAIGAVAGLLIAGEHLSGVQLLALAAIVSASAGAALGARR